MKLVRIANVNKFILSTAIQIDAINYVTSNIIKGYIIQPDTKPFRDRSNFSIQLLVQYTNRHLTKFVS
jgi:hypothetical protein